MRILIIEDHKNWSEIMGRTLKGIAERTLIDSDNHETALTWDVAPSLTAASIMLAGTQWDAVILDLRLKDSEPMETLTWLRKQVGIPPVIVVSGLPQDQPYRTLSFESGADDYFLKMCVVDNWSSFFRSIYHATLRRRRRNQISQYVAA